MELGVVAVTADYLESGVLALPAEDGEEEEEEQAEGGEEVMPLKKIKVETIEGEQALEQSSEKITLENGLVLDICK